MIGCGDSLVATTTAPVRFMDQLGPSIRTLLTKSRAVGMLGLANVLYQSNLTCLGGELDGSTITVYLCRQFMLSEIGSLAAKLLLKRGKGRIGPVSTLVTPRLVLRSTTAPPPARGTAGADRQKELGGVPE